MQAKPTARPSQAVPKGNAPPAVGTRTCDRFANVEVTNQYGERFRFRDRFVDDRSLVINMMYTICRGSCPGTSATLKRLRERLDPVFGDGLTFLSITLDPLNDSVPVLRDYAELYGANQRRTPGRINWQFLTGKATEIDALRRSLGFYDLDPRIDADISEHGALLLFGNTKADRWATLPSGLREGLLIEAIRRVGGSTIEQRYGIRA